jgi:small subunit ribosomal protein S2
MQSALNREYRKIYRNLNGLRSMNRMPECLVIVDPSKERNAIREAKRLGITTVALIDTDSDPESIDLPIPGNDDGIRSIELIIAQLADAVLAGKAQNPESLKAGDASAGASQSSAEAQMAAKAEETANT